MTKADTAKLLQIIIKAYPSSRLQADDDTLNLWHEMLSDLPVDIAASAAKAMIATLRFPPTIADIREAVARSISEARGDLTAGEAWAKVLKAVGRYGYYRGDEARAALGESLWASVQQIGGWSHLCTTDEVEIVSAQFERRYKVMREQEQRRMQIPAQVQDRMRALLAGAPNLTLIEGGRAAGEG